MFQKELAKIQDAENSIKQYVHGRTDETERLFKQGVDQMNAEIAKLNRETYQELDQVDKEMQKLKQQVLLVENRPKFQNPKSNDDLEHLEDLKVAVKELKYQHIVMSEEIQLKSNIKDVCALVDMKANAEDLERGIDTFYKELKLQMNPARSAFDLRTLKDQKLINETFSTLNCLAIWIWHGGFCNSGSSVNLNSTAVSQGVHKRQRNHSRELNYEKGSFGNTDRNLAS